MENFLLQFYGGRADDDGATAVPREILVPVLPSEEAATEAELTEWLGGLRGSRVSVRVPQRGDKRALAETVTRNAAEALAQHRLKRASDLTARSAALTELADTLGMDVAPLRIECIDISHVQGTDVVASLVVFEDGLPKRSDYRRFAIRDRPGDDVASIAEVVRRRFTHGAHRSAENTDDSADDGADAASPVAGRPPDRGTDGTGAADGGSLAGRVVLAPPPGINPETGRPRRFAYPPQLLVVDGGAPQVNAAAAQLAELGIVDVTVCGLAKRLEEVWVPEQDGPDHLPAHQRGAVSAAAAAGRGAPVRDHLPPRQALQVDDGVGAGQRARPRREPAQGAGPALRVGRRAAPGGGRGHHAGAGGRPADRGGGGDRADAGRVTAAPRSAPTPQVPLPSTGTGAQSD